MLYERKELNVGSFKFTKFNVLGYYSSEVYKPVRSLVIKAFIVNGECFIVFVILSPGLLFKCL